jgi:hypothetical protein
MRVPEPGKALLIHEKLNFYDFVLLKRTGSREKFHAFFLSLNSIAGSNPFMVKKVSKTFSGVLAYFYILLRQTGSGSETLLQYFFLSIHNFGIL